MEEFNDKFTQNENQKQFFMWEIISLIIYKNDLIIFTPFKMIAKNILRS